MTLPFPILLDVTIVSDNPETLDGLGNYLRAAGISTHGTRDIAKASTVASRRCQVVVFFPDDYEWDAVLVALVDLSERRPRARPLLVTKDPRRFAAISMTRGSGAPAVIVPKPAWGWTILDAVRSAVTVAEKQPR